LVVTSLSAASPTFKSTSGADCASTGADYTARTYGKETAETCCGYNFTA
tara:strand:+ start:475 stop:621 length:147 start_codon:yes stop_codon:yes gene_type:complete